MNTTTINIYVNNDNQTTQEQWFTMAEAAKLLDGNIGRTRLFRFLREQDLLMENNEPYQRYIDKGYFKMVLKNIFGSRGQIKFQQLVTLVSPKGIVFIQKLLKSEVKGA